MITIIGAAHAGSYLAYLLAKDGFDVQVFEEHAEIGRPIHCTGIVTKSIENLIRLDKDVIVNPLNKARVYSPNMESFDVKVNDYLLDRPKFEQFLAEKAMDKGAVFHLHHSFIGYDNSKKEAIIKSGEDGKIKNFKADILIGADGPNSKIAKMIDPDLKLEYYFGAQAVAKAEMEKDIFEVYLGSICPEFFGWNVAEGDNNVRIGLAAKKTPHKYFQDFLKLKNIKKEDIIENQGGLIPVYTSAIKTQKDNMYIVGDAASMLKATTGGGIIQAMIGCEALVESLKEKKDYESCWKKRLKKDLWLHLKIRKTLDRFSDEDYNRLIRLVGQEKVKSILEKHDRDYPKQFILKLAMAEPRFIFFAKHALKAMVS